MNQQLVHLKNTYISRIGLVNCIISYWSFEETCSRRKNNCKHNPLTFKWNIQQFWSIDVIGSRKYYLPRCCYWSHWLLCENGLWMSLVLQSIWLFHEINEWRRIVGRKDLEGWKWWYSWKINWGRIFIKTLTILGYL